MVCTILVSGRSTVGETANYFKNVARGFDELSKSCLTTGSGFNFS